MHAIHIHTRIESETLHIPELREMIGKVVDVFIREEESHPHSAPANVAPSGPLDAQEIEKLRSDPQWQRFRPLLELAGQEVIDPNAIADLRAASMI